MATTATQRLASHLLGKPVIEWLTYHREDGRSWRWIAGELSKATGGEVTVTHEALRGWVEQDAA